MDIYVGDLISNARSDTQNADDIPTDDEQSGIPTADFLRYANFAQDRLQGKITKKYPFAFQTYKEIDIVGGVSLYSIPDNVSLNTKVVKVEYSKTGLASDYRRLKPGNPYLQQYRDYPYPMFYTRLDGQILLEPSVAATATGKIRVWYIRTLDRMELRRGVVDAVTINGSNQITALSLSTTDDDATELGKISTQYLCVNSVAGVVKCYNIPVNGYDSTTGNVTLVGTPELDAGETVAVGDYVTIGRYTTTHSKLANECERYLTEYVNRRVKKRDSSKDVGELDIETRDMEKDIIENYSVPDLDVKEIPIIDPDMFNIGRNDGRW